MTQHMNKGSNSDTPGYSFATTVARALDILEYIGNHQPVRPSSITKDLNLTRSNVHRLLSTLAIKGYVVKDDSGYFLSFKLLELANSIPFKRDLRAISKPFMKSLMHVVNENVYLNALYGDRVIAIETEKSDNHTILNAEKVYTYPLNTCASGKVILAMLDKNVSLGIINDLEMVPMTKYTIIDREKLRSEIDKVRDQGYALEIQEFNEELNSVAAPIFDYKDKIIATISLSGPAVRLTEAKINMYLNDLISTADEITKSLRK